MTLKCDSQQNTSWLCLSGIESTFVISKVFPNHPVVFITPSWCKHSDGIDVTFAGCGLRLYLLS